MKKSNAKKLAILALTASFAVGSMAGCGMKANKVANDDQTLEVYNWDAGYGTAWLTALLEDFGTLDWVKEKYPNYKYATVYNDQQNFAAERIDKGKNNTIDLFFAEQLRGFFGTDVLLDLTEVVYETEVPDEPGVLVKDKMHDSVYSSIGYVPVGSSAAPKYYQVPWQFGMGGICYNATLFEEMKLTVPNTTDEMIALMQSVKDLNGSNPEYPYTYSWISSNIPYTDYIYPVWWAQYEGAEQYNNYWKGINYEGIRNSTDVFKQTGRLKSLEVMYNIHNANFGYYDRTSSTYDFITGQSRLLLRQGLMMVCGDWFSMEMKDLAAEYKKMGYCDVVDIMKTPIVSAIVEKTPSIVSTATAEGKTADEMLSFVVSEVDEGKTTSSKTTITQTDFDTIKAARSVIFSQSIEAQGAIPADAKAKDLAVDFLRYLSTDRANSIYAQNTAGGRLPFKFHLEKDDPDAFNRMMTENKESFTMAASCSNILYGKDAYVLPYYSIYPLAYYGGLGYAADGIGIHKEFIQDVNRTPKAVFDDIYAYWTSYNNKYWNDALGKAGLL